VPTVTVAKVVQFTPSVEALIVYLDPEVLLNEIVFVPSALVFTVTVGETGVTVVETVVNVLSLELAMLPDESFTII
jgi:hypothetical protein